MNKLSFIFIVLNFYCIGIIPTLAECPDKILYCFNSADAKIGEIVGELL
jgi:hypothetical protein